MVFALAFNDVDIADPLLTGRVNVETDALAAVIDPVADRLVIETVVGKPVDNFPLLSIYKGCEVEGSAVGNVMV